MRIGTEWGREYWNWTGIAVVIGIRITRCDLETGAGTGMELELENVVMEYVNC